MNRLSMQFGLLLHRVVNPVVMGLLFYLTVTPRGLIMRVVGNDLGIEVVGTADSVTVDAWFSGTDNRLDIAAGDGYALADANVQALVNAMAAFSPPSSGEIDLDPAADYYATVSAALAANWQPGGGLLS